jgi:MFS family permease
MTIGVQAVLPAMPILQDVFGISDAAAGWFTLAYTLPGLVLVLPLAALAVRTPRRWTVAFLLVAYALLGLGQALVRGYGELLALRVAQGAVFAAAMPLAFVIIGETFAPRDQLRALSRRATFVTAGELAFPIAGALLATISWKAPFVAQLALLPLAVFALFALDDRRSTTGPNRVRTHIAGVIRAQERGGLILMIGFARFLFKFTFIVYVPLLLVGRGQASVAQAGIIVSIAAGSTGLSAAAVPRVIRRVGPSSLLMAAATAIAASLAALVLTDDPYLSAAIGLCFGLGDGILVVLSDAYVMRTWPAELRPRVGAASQASRNLGKVAAPLVMSVIAAIWSIEAGFVAMACVAALLVPWFARLRRFDERIAPPARGPAVPARA